MMASATPLKDIDEQFLQCCICMEQLKEPKILPCLHRYCQGCLKKFAKKGATEIECVTCREQHTLPKDGIDGLKTDFNTKNIIEFIQLQDSIRVDPLRTCIHCKKRLKASAFCFRCNDFLCGTCHEFHASSSIVKDHHPHIFSLREAEAANLTIQKLSSLKEAPRCQAHPGKLSELCCTTCQNLPICMPCTYGEHRGHGLTEVTSLAKNQREMLRGKVVDLMQFKEKAYQVQEEIRKTTEKLNHNVQVEELKGQEKLDAEERRIKKNIRNAEEELNRKQAELEGEVKAKTSMREKDLEKKMKKLREEYELVCEEDRCEADASFKELQKENKKETKRLQEGLRVVNDDFKELLTSVKTQKDEQAKKIKGLSDHFDGIVKRYETVTTTVNCIRAAENEWADVQCISDVCRAIDLLGEDVKKGSTELSNLSAIEVTDKYDEVIFLGEEKATSEQIARAEKLKLPPNFYLYESKPPCPGCVGCDEENLKKGVLDLKDEISNQATLPTQIKPVESPVQPPPFAGFSFKAAGLDSPASQSQWTPVTTTAATSQFVGFSFKTVGSGSPASQWTSSLAFQSPKSTPVTTAAAPSSFAGFSFKAMGSGSPASQRNSSLAFQFPKSTPMTTTAATSSFAGFSFKAVVSGSPASQWTSSTAFQCPKSTPLTTTAVTSSFAGFSFKAVGSGSPASQRNSSLAFQFPKSTPVTTTTATSSFAGFSFKTVGSGSPASQWTSSTAFQRTSSLAFRSPKSTSVTTTATTSPFAGCSFKLSNSQSESSSSGALAAHMPVVSVISGLAAATTQPPGGSNSLAVPKPIVTTVSTAKPSHLIRLPTPANQAILPTQTKPVVGPIQPSSSAGLSSQGTAVPKMNLAPTLAAYAAAANCRQPLRVGTQGSISTTATGAGTLGARKPAPSVIPGLAAATTQPSGGSNSLLVPNPIVTSVSTAKPSTAHSPTKPLQGMAAPKMDAASTLAAYAAAANRRQPLGVLAQGSIPLTAHGTGTLGARKHAPSVIPGLAAATTQPPGRSNSLLVPKPIVTSVSTAKPSAAHSPTKPLQGMAAPKMDAASTLAAYAAAANCRQPLGVLTQGSIPLTAPGTGTLDARKPAPSVIPGLAAATTKPPGGSNSLLVPKPIVTSVSTAKPSAAHSPTKPLQGMAAPKMDAASTLAAYAAAANRRQPLGVPIQGSIPLTDPGTGTLGACKPAPSAIPRLTAATTQPPGGSNSLLVPKPIVTSVFTTKPNAAQGHLIKSPIPANQAILPTQTKPVEGPVQPSPFVGFSFKAAGSGSPASQWTSNPAFQSPNSTPMTTAAAPPPFAGFSFKPSQSDNSSGEATQQYPQLTALLSGGPGTPTDDAARTPVGTSGRKPGQSPMGQTAASPQRKEVKATTDKTATEQAGASPGLFASSAGPPGGLFSNTAITGISFAALSAEGDASGFKKSESSKPFAFAGAGAQLFGGSPGGQRDAADRGHAEEYDPHYEPIIALPDKVEVVTGDEGHEVIFRERAKLYRFDTASGAWKERGVGEMKILRNPETGQSRILMRREQVLKVCANHLLSPDMSLQPMSSSDRAWVWLANDFAEGEGCPEQFAIKFKLPGPAAEFKDAFDRMKESIVQEPSLRDDDREGEKVESGVTEDEGGAEEPVETDEGGMEHRFQTADPVVSRPEGEEGDEEDGDDDEDEDGDYGDEEGYEEDDDEYEYEEVGEYDDGEYENRFNEKLSLADQFRPSPGTWVCDTCMIQNPAEKNTCLACAVPKPSDGSQDAGPSMSDDKPSLVDMFRPPAGSWACDTCMVNNPGDKTACMACTTPKPGAQPSQPTASSFSFGAPKGPTLFGSPSGSPFSFKVPSGFPSISSAFSAGSSGTGPKPGLFSLGETSKQSAPAGPTPVGGFKSPPSVGFTFGASKPELSSDPGASAINAKPFGSGASFSFGGPSVNTNANADSAPDSTVPDTSIDKPAAQPEDQKFMFGGGMTQFSFGAQESQKKPSSSFSFASLEATPPAPPASESTAPSSTSSGFQGFSFAPKPTATDAKGAPSSFAGSGQFNFRLNVDNVATSPPKLEEKPTVKSPMVNSSGLNKSAEYYQSDERDDLHFEPVVTLPENVKLETGEEGEEVRFEHRAKLYRWDRDGSQWKERGVGDIKVLFNPETNKYRIVMRREQVLKVCANHFITEQVDLQPNAGSDRSWVWHAMDVSDGEVQYEQLAVRFKTGDAAKDFKDAVDAAKENS